MFTIPPYFISQIFEDGGTSGGSDVVESNDDSTDSVDDDLGVPYVAPSVEQDKGEVQNTEPESQGGISPAWKAVLDPLPQEFHKQVLPHLESWDKNFAEVQSRFAPYKPLLENNISIDDIQSSLQLAQFISADPQAVYEELGRRYGFGKEQGREQVNEPNQQEQEQEYLDLAEQEQNPQLLQLQQTVNGLQQMLADQEAQKQEAYVRESAQREIDNEWSSIEQQVGRQLTPDIRKEVTRRAIVIGDETGNYSIAEGYKDYAEFVNRVRNSRANNTAPSVLPGNGGQPVTKKNLGQMDEEERQNHIAEMTRILVEGQK